jgi:peptidoglycan/xylan/chitin deacetylase (PgdA/CDA1 family)
MKIILLPCLLVITAVLTVQAQTKNTWNNKSCAVVLTYDDAIDADLDRAIPALDSLGLKGTFYLIGSSSVISNRMYEWRRAAQNGHELGNHTLYHPCDGSKPNRSFVGADHDLSTYTVGRAIDEIRVTNTLLKAIDGKSIRTFAYPCGDTKIGDTYFYNALSNEFAGARGVSAGLQNATDVKLDNIQCYGINGEDGAYMINLVKQAQKTHTLLVFLFHGVGGGHNLNVDIKAHSELLHYLKNNEKDIWIAPMVDVATKIKALQKDPGERK